VTCIIAAVICLASVLLCGCCVWTTIFYMGLVRFLIVAWDFVELFREHFLTRRLDLAKRYGLGSWVFVTGAANGIGLEYCNKFAELGFNLIMVDIDQNALDKAKKHLQIEHKDCEILTTK
jgi:hypothetical protein